MADLERQTPSDDPSSCCSVGHTKASCGNDPSGTSSAHCSSTQSASSKNASTENAPTDSTSAATPEGTQRLDVIVDEMCCPTEERVLRKALNSLPGVEQLTFDTMQRRLTIHHRNVDRRAVASRIQEAGMTARFLDQAKQEPPRDSASLPWARLAVAGALALGAEVTGWLGLGVPWLAALLAIIAIAMVGLPTWKKGLLALRQGTLNINALMSVAVTGAMLIGHWSEAAMVIVLFTLAEHLEARSLERARRAISGLLDLAPPMARVRDESAAEANRWREIKAEEVRPGALVRVFAGERLALDGEIVRGEASLDEAPITAKACLANAVQVTPFTQARSIYPAISTTA